MSEQENTPQYQQYLLERALSVAKPETRVGTSEGVGALNSENLTKLLESLGVDLQSPAYKTIERYGGVSQGGYRDDYFASSTQDVYLLQTYNSQKGVDGNQPSARSVIKIKLDD